MKNVGVLLMLLVSGIEMAASMDRSAAEGGRGGKGDVARSRGKREERAQVERRREAAGVLALARRSTSKKAGFNLHCGETADGADKGCGVPAVVKKKRVNLRKRAKVEDGLRAWATRHTRQVPRLRALLGFTDNVGPDDALVVRERVVRIPVADAANVRTKMKRLRVPDYRLVYWLDGYRGRLLHFCFGSQDVNFSRRKIVQYKREAVFLILADCLCQIETETGCEGEGGGVGGRGQATDSN